MAIQFKQFYIGVTEENTEMLLDELEELCKKYADDDYLFRWEAEEDVKNSRGSKK